MCLLLKDPDVYVKNDLSRFIWNFLASRTASGPASLASGALTHSSRQVQAQTSEQSYIWSLTDSSLTGEAGGCDPHEYPCEPGAVCQGFRVDQDRSEDNGCCLFATAKYVPSYSTAITCKVLPPRISDGTPTCKV